MKNVQSLADHFLNERYVSFTEPSIIPLIEPVFKGFKKLVAMPEEYKRPWQIHHPELSKKPDHGLIFPKGGDFDEKWMFMYRIDMIEDLLRNKVSIGALSDYVLWFDTLSSVYSRLLLIIKEFISEVDTQMPGYNLYEQVNAPEVSRMHVMRLLEYLYKQSAERGKPLADGHFDQGFLTAQAYESSPGLILVPNKIEGDKETDWKEISYNYEPGKIILFPGRKFGQATNGQIPGMWHYVKTGPPVDRNALILFSHTPQPSIEMR